MNPYCLRAGVALTPWSPLAQGILTGAYQGGFAGGSTDRSRGQDRARTESLYRGEHVFDVAARVVEVGQRTGLQPAQVALAWLLAKPGVTAPIVGASRAEQIEALIEATSVELAPEDIAYLEAPYRPVDNLLSLGYS